MSLIKEYLHQLEVESDEVWESYLEWVSSPQQREVFNQLPKNIKDLFNEGGYYEE